MKDIEKNYYDSLCNIEQRYIYELVSQEKSKFGIFEDENEENIVEEHLSSRIKKTVHKIIETEKNQRTTPCTASELICVVEKIKTTVPIKANKLMKKEHSFRDTFISIKEKIVESIDENLGLILIAGAGISNAPRKVEKHAMYILKKQCATVDNEKWKDEYWELIEKYREEFTSMFSKDSGWEGVSPTFAQQMIAKLFIDKKLRQCIIFNWDDIIERVCIEDHEVIASELPIIVGECLPSDYNPNKCYFWHPNGLVGNPFPLCLPHEAGSLPNELIDICNNYVGIFLIVGHRDENNPKLTNLFLKRSYLDIVRIRNSFDRCLGLQMEMDRDKFFELLKCWLYPNDN